MPHPGDPVTRTDAEHSAAIDHDLIDYERSNNGPWRWIVGNVGKHWVDYPMQSAAPLYGWHSDKTKLHMMPAPTYPSESIGGLYVIQRPWDSSHGDSHSDYSMTGVFARDDEPDEYYLLDEGEVIHVDRTPASIDRCVEPWKDPTIPYGERVVAWAQRHIGIEECPPGSNNGPHIAPWLRACERDGQPSFGAWLARAGGSWCAAFASAAVTEARLDDDEPFVCRASGLELENDAKRNQSWRPVSPSSQGRMVARRRRPCDHATRRTWIVAASRRGVLRLG